MPPAALTLSSHIFQTTSCFLASSASGPVSASGAPILITSAALAANADTAIVAATAAVIRKYRLDLNNITTSDRYWLCAMSARLPDITSDPCVAERHNATRVCRTITMIRMTIPCKTDWVCGLAEPTDFELPRPAQVGRKVRRQRLHLPRTAATLRESSSTPLCERTSSAPTISSPTCWVATRACTPGRRAGCPTCGRLFRIERNAVLVAADMHAAERQFRHLAGEVFGGRSTSIRCESVPP